MRIVFAGTPLFAEKQLASLLKANYAVISVYTQPDKPAGRGQHLQVSPVKTLALKHHLPIEQPQSLKANEVVTKLSQYQPDIMVVAAYGLLFPPSILSIPRLGCINVHASLLPRWRGASPIHHAILAGDPQTGVTIMQMDEGLDTGDILAQKPCTIHPDDTTSTLQERLAELGANLLVEKLKGMPLAKQKQNEGEVTYAPKIKKEQALIDWHTPALEIERKIRAYYPWPIAYTFINGQLLRLWKAKWVSLPKAEIPGKILQHTPQGIIIASKKDAILLEMAQLPSKKALPLFEMLKGHHELFAVGNILG